MPNDDILNSSGYLMKSLDIQKDKKIRDNGTTRIIYFLDFLRETERHQKTDTSSILGKTTQESLYSWLL